MAFPVEVVFASGNAHTHEELAALLAPVGISLVFGPERLSLEVEETGRSYAENALIKAKAWSRALGMPSLADDSGLEVRELAWAPGLYSSRVASNDAGRISWLLERMEGKTDRTARFVACLALTCPDVSGMRVALAEGLCWGEIAREASGQSGFGYDPVFIPQGHDRSFGDLGEGLKSRISHRVVASRALRDMLETPSMVKSLSVRFGETD